MVKVNLEPGEYIRFDSDGMIGIIENVEIKNEDITNPICIELYGDDCGLLCEKKEVKKHSKNIWNLLEIGDILELELSDGKKSKIELTEENKKDILNKLKRNKVKLLSILTYQQYNNNHQIINYNK